ncbi:MAG: Tryptophan synthase alpha chain [Candidatus Omnitrophica bacterium]|nr:Tryptophan synthase alpha chain [Candidatus Omnitrophota bacterium]
MTNRIDRTFAALRERRQKAMIAFITAGHPTLTSTVRLAVALEREGVDLLEIGVPFSDPLADGPVIQASSLTALKNGVTVRRVLDMVGQARRSGVRLPILLMSYANPILRYGIRRFAADAARAGVDGVILPDVPPDEGGEIDRVLARRGLHTVYLLAPTSSGERERLVLRRSKGFVYYVSLTGVTGADAKDSSRVIESHVRRARRGSELPVCVGFGVSTPEAARRFCAYSDGVIVGSAIVRELSRTGLSDASAFARRVVRPFVRAVRSVKAGGD